MHLPAHLPGPLRAAVGLVASAADEAKHLPDRAIELPMLAVSTALQLSLRAQQRYAQLTVRGDEAVSAMSRRTASDEPPAWATFDEDLPEKPSTAETSVTAAAGAPSDREPATPTAAPDPTAPTAGHTTTTAPAARKQSGRKSPAKKTARKKTPPARSNGKGVSAPRHTSPSRFDTIGDE